MMFDGIPSQKSTLATPKPILAYSVGVFLHAIHASTRDCRSWL